MKSPRRGFLRRANSAVAFATAAFGAWVQIVDRLGSAIDDALR